jgi:hypothetical protein
MRNDECGMRNGRDEASSGNAGMQGAEKAKGKRQKAKMVQVAGMQGAGGRFASGR